MTKLQAPFPYFGGKMQVSDIVWKYLGQPAHYIEPFFGSGAVLLARPNYNPEKHTETINDKDGFVANVWRSIQFSPDEVAKWCDWPVNHADLIARKNELIKNEPNLLKNLCSDPNWHDPIMAGYWIWGISCWIGSGWPNRSQRRPNIAKGGTGVHSQRVRGLKRPAVSRIGTGVHSTSKRANIYSIFNQLSQRLRNVRVVCGDWSRVCGGDWQDGLGICGIFFDPPYGEKAKRSKGLYSTDDMDVADKVREWCIERGQRKTHRIILAGYYEEHESLIQEGWRVEKWTAQGGYGNQGNAQGKENREKEALFISPFCLGHKSVDQKGISDYFKKPI